MAKFVDSSPSPPPSPLKGEGVSGDLQQILEALEKPLRFASGNDYANLKNLRGLEPYLSGWLEKASALPLSQRRLDLFNRLKLQVKGFDGMDLARKKTIVIELQEILNDLKCDDAVPVPCELWPTQAEFREFRRDLQTPIQFIKGVGPRLSEILKKKNIRTVEDALYFLPRFYQDRRQIKTISQLAVGKVETVMGTVRQAEMSYYRKRRTFELAIGDETGTLVAKWFNFNPRFMKGRFRQWLRLILSGEVILYQFQKEMHHPEL